MANWRRRVRGAIGMGIAWAVAWFGAGVALALAFPGAADVPFPILWGALGFVGGVTFSAVLGLIEGRRRFDEMSLPRFAGWGGVGGLLLSGMFVLITALFGATEPLEHFGLLAAVFGAAGAGSAAGSLALARRAEEPEAVDAGAARREVRPADDEDRRLRRGGSS